MSMMKSMNRRLSRRRKSKGRAPIAGQSMKRILKQANIKENNREDHGE